jgi:amphi-Trp domain-containing protein
MKKKNTRDIEKKYSDAEFIKKLRRLADALEKKKRFSIQVAGEKIVIPAGALINIEHEKGKDEEELEFQIKWKNRP